MKENKIKKVKEQLEELEEIEEEFYDEHEELDYIIDIKEIEKTSKDVKMQDINKQIDVISKNYKKEGSRLRKYVRDSYGEILEILKYMDTSYTYQVPVLLTEYFEKNTSKDYVKHINPKYSLYSQNIEDNTKTLLALVNIKYWAKDKHKEKLITIYNINNQNS